ncbi:MAG: type I methionyl aminopeptidase [Alphaproteobacteria bacterium]
MSYMDADEMPLTKSNAVRLHSPADFEGMRAAGKLAAACLDMLVPHVQPGITTNQIDKLCYDFILDHNAVPACLNYRGYPKTVCTSINHVICHGIPDDKPLKSGQIVNIDVTVIVDGWHGDTSRMYLIGDVPLKARKLVDCTYEAMMRGIEVVKPGATLGDIGHAIQSHAEGQRYSIVTDFCGHGLGRVFHDNPNVLHYGNPGEGLALKEGMFFTIEPMVNQGKPNAKILRDGWTAVSRDRSLSAQFEHSIGVTADGVEIFTKSPAGLDRPPYSS